MTYDVVGRTLNVTQLMEFLNPVAVHTNISDVIVSKW